MIHTSIRQYIYCDRPFHLLHKHVSFFCYMYIHKDKILYKAQLSSL
jgi:hypothetical protein